MSKNTDRPDTNFDDETLILEHQKTSRPRQYQVLMLNDDYTTQDFVEHVLMRFFHKESTQATQIMLTIHLKGQAKVGIYSKDVAETKVAQVQAYAETHSFPLLLKTEAI